MSEDKQVNNQDIFVLNSIYPNAEALFSFSLAPLSKIKDEAVVVIDTNALLVPYNIGSKSLSQIRDTYQKLISVGKFVIPGQVAREFAKNRGSKTLGLFQQFNQKRENVKTFQKGKYPLLESVSEYQDVLRLEKEIDDRLSEYKSALKSVLDVIQGWTWNDPVSLIYRELFNGNVILDPEFNQEDMQKDLERRQRHHIPPGYKDSSKDDQGVGDLLIWNAILHIGKEQKRHVIFVSGDQKSDWWYKSEKQSIYPRYELVEEFRRSSNGCSFHILSFSAFLELFGVAEDALEEVREEETRQSYHDALIGEFVRKWWLLQQKLYKMYQELQPEEGQRHVPFAQAIQFLLHNEFVSRAFAHDVQSLMRIRSRVTHEGNRLVEHEVQHYLRLLDDLLSELESQYKA